MFDMSPSGPLLTAFTLGRADLSLSFLHILPEEVSAQATSTLAFRLLLKLWEQYRIDRQINIGRTLFSADNGIELRTFTSLVDKIATWSPLREANLVVRQHSPALDRHQNALFDSQIEQQLELAHEVKEQLERIASDRNPVDRVGLLVDRCRKLNDVHEDGICWALNLVCANDLNPLAASNPVPPFPALLRRELLRSDRSMPWRQVELDRHLTASAQDLAATIMSIIHDFSEFSAKFPSLRQNSRLATAFSFLAGLQDLTPHILAKLIGCTEPGARKMLRQLAEAGFATQHPLAPAFVATESYRLGWPRDSWLWSSSLVDDSPYEKFDDE